MRSRLRLLTIAACLGSALVLLLLVAAAATGTAGFAIAAGVLGVLGVGAGGAAVLTVIRGVVTTTDRLATRASALERRGQALAEWAETAERRAASLEERAEALESRAAGQDAFNEEVLDRRAEVASTLRSHHEDAVQVHAELTGLAQRSDRAEERLGGVEERAEALGAHAARQDLFMEEALAHRAEVMTMLETVEKDVAAARTRIARLTTAQNGSAERIARLTKDMRTLRARVPAGFLDPVEKQLADLERSSRENRRTAFESALQLGRSPREILTPARAQQLFRDYVLREDYLRLRPLIENFDILQKQSLTTLRAIYRFYRSAGYWDLAQRAVEEIHAKSGRENDELSATRIAHEIDVFAHPLSVRPDLPEADAHDPSGPILHMVGRVLPDTQTGYTLRTQYTAMAQTRKGLRVAIVGQAGIVDREVTTLETYEHQGIDYYLLPGPPRNTMLLNEWLALNMRELAALVRDVRPSILHAQSDFFNELIVDVVGRRYGIPTVYESRGFWEESWLSRTITAKGWGSAAESIFDMYGVPPAYELRKHAEEVARTRPAHVFTLAEVMRDHILESAHGRIDPSAVSIVPNAVESANFPVQSADPELKAELGIPEDAVVVGYISSIVEYEGIDTLIDGFHLAQVATSQPTYLLLVGDGDHRAVLERHVQDNNIPNVCFAGRVPHEKVLDYYGLIDVFVVPRKPAKVADLVTPLKPFEAFSTGRAVVLSDVGALQEIADQSRAVETFRAGDSQDLAAVLAPLITDSERRHTLGEKAARWVRNHRSWDANVNEYYRVYTELGYTGGGDLVIESELDLTARGMNPGELLEALRSAPLPPLTGWFTLVPLRQTGRSILEEGWKYANFDPVPVATIEDWARYGAEHRSWGFNLHTWKFIDPLLRDFDETGEENWLREAVRIARSWYLLHREADDDADPMAWYDMSTSLRTPRLLALMLRAARIDDLRDDAIILAAAFAWHLEELHKDRAYNPNNNHGFYTAVSQVHAAKYAEMFSDAGATGQEGRIRLEEVVSSQFAEDGVHLEHSPDYHRMLLGSFEQAIQDELLEDEVIEARIRRAAHVLGWMVQPDGTLVQFGDSPENRVARPRALSIDPATQFILSDGMRGEPETRELAVFPDGGYAFVRSPQPAGPGELGGSGYLAFSAAFHSRAHKHADDLNVVWYDRGHQILVDAGRFGYGELLSPDSPERRKGFYYAAPERQYVEGTMAHNTVMMDGRDQERRARTPYGSALGDCIETGGVFDLSGRVHHDDYIHRRRVVYRPGEQLLLKDSIFAQSPERREGIVWLNVAGHFELEAIADEVVFVTGEGDALTRLSISSQGRLIEPVRGQKDPLRGWRSRMDGTMDPVWSIGFAFEVDTRMAMDTILRLS